MRCVVVPICVTLVLVCAGVAGVWGCSEVVCASMVSKCMLTQACKCDLTNTPGNNCTCCLDCAKCLGYLYTDCCSCLGMCEPHTQMLDRTDSQVGDFPEPFPLLFQALDSERDPMLRWSTFTFPIDIALTDIDATDLDRSKYSLGPHPQDTTTVKTQVTVNCTVLYMAQCSSSVKCKEFCHSTGAAAYRWFFDGCCECVGSTCINYGVNESRCMQCPTANEEFDDDLTDQLLSAEPAHHFDEAAAQGEATDDQDADL